MYQKKKYEKPELTTHGNLKTFTRAKVPSDSVDGEGRFEPSDIGG